MILIVYVSYMIIQSGWVISPWHTEGVILFAKYVVLVYIVYKLVITEEMMRRLPFDPRR